MDTKLIANAIAVANANSNSFRGLVYDASGKRVGYVYYMNGLCKSIAAAVSMVSDTKDGADLLPAFTRLLGSDMPEGGFIKISAKRKNNTCN